MRVVTMVMVMSQHETFKLRDGVRPVNSKDSIQMIGFRNAVDCQRRLEEVGQTPLTIIVCFQRWCFWEIVFTTAAAGVVGKPAAY
jgi:hypothetical protein